MKHILSLFCTMLFSSLVLNGQVTIKTNMPPVMEPNTETTVQVKIIKGAIINFAKYQVDVPAGIIIKEDDSKGGAFTFDNNRLKIIWANIPTEAEFSLSIKVLSGSFTGPATINQKFYYMEEGVRKEVDAEPLTLTIGDGAKNSTNIGELPPDQNTQKNPEILQAEQLKKDSKDAYQTGLKEKEAADKKLAEAEDAIKRAETLQDEELKKAALEKANANKQKAQTDKAVASKILMLAKSLDDNANEIERLNKSNPAAAHTTITTTTPAAPVSDNGLVYRLQLGAFSQNPEKILYKHMGTINIVNEGGMYKVLMGKFTTHEDAAKRRDELVAKSFDCFIVTYKDGARVK